MVRIAVTDLSTPYLSLRVLACQTHHWPSLSYPPRAYIFLSPGYRDHSLRWESIARALSALGYSVWSLDHQGHGQSQGDRGFVWSFDDYVEDYLLFVEHVRANLDVRPCFLLGRGMGATIATLVMRAYADIEEERKREAASRSGSSAASPDALQRMIRSSSAAATAAAPLTFPSASSSSSSPSGSLSTVASPRPHSPRSPRAPASIDDSDARAAAWKWHGCVLLSPAIIPPPTLSPLSEMFAHLFCDVLPHMHFFSVLDDSKLSRLPSVVRQWEADPLVFKQGMRARWAVEFLHTMNELKEDAHVGTQHTTHRACEHISNKLCCTWPNALTCLSDRAWPGRVCVCFGCSGHHVSSAAVSGQRGRLCESERRRVAVQAQSER